jgi:hypothetical protein
MTARAIVLAAIVICAARIHAAAPTNDTCAGAIVVPDNGPFPYLTPPVDVSGATTNGDPVLPLPQCRSGSVSHSIWYRFTPATTATYTISTCGDTVTSLPDTVMAVYTASGACGGFSLLDCADDTCGIRAAIELQLTAGTTYYIVVWNSGDTLLFPNATTVQLRVSPPPPVLNDTCAGAEVIPDSGPFPYLSSVADTRLAGKTGDPPSPNCASLTPDRSVWYRFTPAASGTYNFSLCNDTATTVYDTLLAIYSAPGCSGPFTRVACDDNACEFQSAITTNLTAGTTYYIVAWDPDHTTGESLLQLRVATADPRITSARRLDNGSFELRFAANVSQSYTVEASPNLGSSWAQIGSVTPTNSSPVFVDVNTSSFSRRFYRLRSP